LSVIIYLRRNFFSDQAGSFSKFHKRSPVLTKRIFQDIFCTKLPFAKFFENCHAATPNPQKDFAAARLGVFTTPGPRPAGAEQLATADPGSSVVELLTEDFIECAD
jgi:hypothetical protein